jgi:hypothetical protein
MPPSYLAYPRIGRAEVTIGVTATPDRLPTDLAVLVIPAARYDLSARRCIRRRAGGHPTSAPIRETYHVAGLEPRFLPMPPFVQGPTPHVHPNIRRCRRKNSPDTAPLTPRPDRGRTSRCVPPHRRHETGPRRIAHPRDRDRRSIRRRPTETNRTSPCTNANESPRPRTAGDRWAPSDCLVNCHHGFRRRCAILTRASSPARLHAPRRRVGWRHG